MDVADCRPGAAGHRFKVPPVGSTAMSSVSPGAAAA